ncbi:hypothetical protein A2U01_0086457, partial [Trifolium medium]|nr:hypothetical protein [Trifolium medium]
SDLKCYAEIQWWRQSQQSAGTRHEALPSDHRVIFASGTHNMGDENHGNPMADACRPSHE